LREHSASNDRGQRDAALRRRMADPLCSCRQSLQRQVMPSCAKVRLAGLPIQFGALDVRQASER
jgi:hypothetical protein